MNRKALVVTLASGLVGALCLHLYLERFEREMAGGAPRPIIMVTRDLAVGDELTREHLAVRTMPERYVEERHVAAENLDRVLGARLATRVASGSSLLWSDLDIAQGGRSLSSLVRAGMRAYALSARNVTFDGLLRAGDRVDVLWTGNDGSRTVTLLENILVLASGRGDDQIEGLASGTLALSVTAEAAERLAYAEQRGRLTLILRNPDDVVLSQRASGVSGACLEGEPCR